MLIVIISASHLDTPNDNLKALDSLYIVFLKIVLKVDMLKNQGFHKYSFDNISDVFVL
jgi:hypothetical protein